MKNFIFLFSVCISCNSFGQVQEQKLETPKVTPETQIEVKKTSKVNKIDHRVDVSRPKKLKVSPAATKEP